MSAATGGVWMTAGVGRFGTFRPILAGARSRDRVLASGGALLAVAITGALGALVVGPGAALPFLVAPIGASAILIFLVPASPLAQPWPVIGGNVIATLTGVGVHLLIHDPVVAAGIAVGAAIAVMSVLRCLHPPGGAAALSVVISGSAFGAGSFLVLAPIALNSVVIVALGWLFHRFSTHSYPHRTPPTDRAERRSRFRAEDVDRALAEIGESFDISKSDIGVLLREVETQALVREHGGLTAADVMSREIIKVDVHDSPETARTLLLAHDVRTLPVLDDDGRVVGTVGLRELVRPATCVGLLATPPLTASDDTPVMALGRILTDGRAHAVVIVDPDGGVRGMITQTDLLVALCRLLSEPT